MRGTLPERLADAWGTTGDWKRRPAACVVAPATADGQGIAGASSGGRFSGQSSVSQSWTESTRSGAVIWLSAALADEGEGYFVAFWRLTRRFLQL
jgi:hypothetical protein